MVRFTLQFLFYQSRQNEPSHNITLIKILSLNLALIEIRCKFYRMTFFLLRHFFFLLSFFYVFYIKDVFMCFKLILLDYLHVCVRYILNLRTQWKLLENGKILMSFVFLIEEGCFLVHVDRKWNCIVTPSNPNCIGLVWFDFVFYFTKS